MEKINFKDLDVSKDILKAVADMGFEEATPIQALAIPKALEGLDIVGQAQTGTGKTAAFAIPMLENIDEAISSKLPQALILCPTRELAIQVAEEVNKLIKFKRNISVVPVYGGQDIRRQITALKKGANIIVGTPGRVMDHMRRKTLRFDELKMLILDEADEMLNMGFREDIELILEDMPLKRQTLLFSATMPKAILRIIDKYQKDPEILKVEHKELTTPNIKQCYLDVRQKDKIEILSRLVDTYNSYRTIVFCNTKKRTDEVSDSLQLRGYMADKIHGDMTQQLRSNVLNKFKKGEIEILVATDVAARGIDIDGIDTVVNFDIPTHEEYYVHRIGRTGRANREGTSYSFVTAKEVYALKNIMKYTNSKIERISIPTLNDIEAKQTYQFLTKLRSEMKENIPQKYIKLVEKLVDEDFNVVEVAAALLKLELDFDSKREEVKAVEHSIDNKDKNDSRRDGGKSKSSRGGNRNQNRIFISLGKKQKVTAKDIVGAIIGETKLAPKKIGAIEIYDNFSFVEVPKDSANLVLKKLNKTRIKRFRVVAEIAKEDPNKKRSSKNKKR